MDLALYHDELGYYARAAQRSGRAGDFFTSVDVGALFGELLAMQVDEMAQLIKARGSTLKAQEQVEPSASSFDTFAAIQPFDFVEAGAGNGRLAADILTALRRNARSTYDRLRLHLVEASGAARAAQPATLGDMADRLASTSERLPSSFDGILLANELFDAMPVHQVVMREDGLREMFVAAGQDGRLATFEAEPSTPLLAEYLERAGVELEPGWRAEINLRAIQWIRDAARRLRAGFIIAIDYGHEAHDLYSASHAGGTLTTFTAHTLAGPERSASTPPWLDAPGERDITAHVDFTSLRAAAEAEGLRTLGFLDQTYFLMALANLENPSNLLNPSNLASFKTLIMPGGLGSTHKVLMLGKGVGAPALRGCSYRMRVT